MNVYLNDLGILCPLGATKSEILLRVLAGDRSGLKTSNKFGIDTVVGECNVELPMIAGALNHYACRNNQLLLAALEQIQDTVNAIINGVGADRVGVILGTSTSGVSSTEDALAYLENQGGLPKAFHYKQQQMGACADFLANHLGVTGPTFTLSTACSASGKAFASARRLINLDFCDAVVVGGADSLCNLTIHGFAALESLSSGHCKPFGKHRDGINISEGAALFVLSKEAGPVRLAGIGASSDAYHFSAPDPEGDAVTLAMQTALHNAGIEPGDVNYLNLHGTATVLNDAMESKAVNRVFGEQLAVSSSKGMTGHALGAAAAIELGLCWLLLTQNENNQLIPNINGDVPDTALPALNFVQPGDCLARKINVCQSNSFAFGGNNISIVLTKVD